MNPLIFCSVLLLASVTDSASFLIREARVCVGPGQGRHRRVRGGRHKAEKGVRR
jgi:hypothetical protein